MANSRSTSHSRVRSVNGFQRSDSYIIQPESLILPEGGVNEETASLLEGLVNPRHHEQEETLVDGTGQDRTDPHDELEILKHRQSLPWWKRPSFIWVLLAMPLSAIMMSAILAPRVEIYTMIACATHKPDVFKDAYSQDDRLRLGIPEFDSSLPILPPQRLDGVLGGSIFTRHAISSTNDTDSEKDKSNLCASDPVVQAAVSKLVAALTTTMGVLSAITTSYWGSFSDRYGRVRLMGIAITGLLLTDINFILVAHFFRQLPGGYWFLVVTAVLEGFLGGLSSASAAMHSYLADTTLAGTRSRIFSLTMGLFFLGMGVGPSIGSLFVRATGRTIYLFYASTALHFIYALLTWCILPEPLTKAQMHLAREKWAAEARKTSQRREPGFAVAVLVLLRRMFKFLTPLDVFAPQRSQSDGNPLKKPKRDWSLSLIAASYGFVVILLGSYTIKFQFAASQFHWSSQTIGYWLSLVGLTRAVCLIVVLPVLIRLLKPKPKIIKIPVEDIDENIPVSEREYKIKEIHSPSFELGVARTSMFIELIAYGGISALPKPIPFTVFSMFGSFGAGFGPAIQTVALDLHVRRTGNSNETGKLFGALSVIQALSSQIIGPALFNWIYATTVATEPRTIFFVATASLFISFMLLCLVRIPKDGQPSKGNNSGAEESDAREPLLRESTLVETSD